MSTDEQQGRGRSYSDEEILNALRSVKEKYGRVTMDLYLEEPDVPAASVVIGRFADDDADIGGWLRAKEAAGVGGDERKTNSRPREYSTEEMLDMIRECERRHGRASQKTFKEDDDFCSPSTVRQRFGTWTDAKRKAGVRL